MFILSGIGLSVSLPDPKDWAVIKPRAQEIASTLDGSAVISSWAKSIEGATVQYEQWVSEAQYLAAVALDRHATQTQWYLSASGHGNYTVTIDITGAARRFKNGAPGRDLSMNVFIVEEISA